MNRENAIKKLKEAKDLLELEIITQEEYDKLKAELTPIIKDEKKQRKRRYFIKLVNDVNRCS